MNENGDVRCEVVISGTEEKDSPGKGKEANWLPAPNGPIYLVMRLYWPTTAPPSILPVGKGTWTPPAVVKAE